MERAHHLGRHIIRDATLAIDPVGSHEPSIPTSLSSITAGSEPNPITTSIGAEFGT